MNRGNNLRVALIDLRISHGGHGWRISRDENIRTIEDMLCLLSPADLNRVFSVCCVLLDYPVEPAVEQHAQQVFELDLGEAMAALPEPKGSVTIF